MTIDIYCPPHTQLSLTVAAIGFFVFYIPRNYCGREETMGVVQSYGTGLDNMFQ